jgi:uncharacterized protein (DUF58 family)
MHRSPNRGFSIEFAEHREYTPGVDPRHIDWRVYGRNDKLYVKQYEEETSLRCYLLLDRSASMGYQHGRAMTKLAYGSYLAASLAYLMAFQHDAVGLITYDSGVRDQTPPRQGPAHLRLLMEKLERTQPGGKDAMNRFAIVGGGWNGGSAVRRPGGGGTDCQAGTRSAAPGARPRSTAPPAPARSLPPLPGDSRTSLSP